jgi:ribosomal-protein-alanine N-acetyltransferase
MAGQWREKSDANEWIKTNLESENSYNFIIELLPQSDTASSSSSSSTSETISNPLPPKPPTTEPVTIGSIGIHRDQEVGYMFHPDYWGKGYATEALDAFVKKVWEVLAEVKKLTGFTDSENAGSQGVLRKCGFKEVRREPYVNATMGERTEVIFEIVRPEYKSGDVCSW